MATKSHCSPQDSSDPGYQNWLVGRKQTPHQYGTSLEPRIQIPPGLNLSSRRGPEVELYDVAGAHLLAPIQDSSDLAVESNSVADSRYSRGLWFTSCWPTPNQAGRTTRSSFCNTPVVLTNKSTTVPSPIPYTLGRLPTKAAHGNGNCNGVRTSLCLAANFNPLKRFSGVRSTTRKDEDSPTECSPPVLCGIPIAGCARVPRTERRRLTSEQNKYYKYGFVLVYRRSEISTFLLLQLLISIAQSVYVVTNATYNTTDSPLRSHSTGSFLRLHLSHSDWGRLVMLLCSSVLSLAGLLSANWDWIATRSTDDQGVEQKDTSRAGDRNVANLLIVQLFRRRLRWAHVFAYLACMLLGVAMLPWLPLFRLMQVLPTSHRPGIPAVFSLDNCSDAFKTNISSIVSGPVSSPRTLHFQNWLLQHYAVADPNDNLWVVLWIIVALQGLFDRDGLWSRYWRYALTLLLSIGHFVLSSVFGVLMIGHDSGLLSSTNGSQPCSAWTRAAYLVTGTRWWDELNGILFRTNASVLIALIAAHFIGRLVASMTSAQRYHLFLTAGFTQAKLHRLDLTENKLGQLTRSLVPAPLADELGRDFVAGYLGWSSPLVIYLRNVSFLSAELVGLSSLASVVASSPTASVASQQFVSLLNDLFGCFDRISRREGCYRVRLNAAEYLCIAGYPETRVDHARSCVDFGLTMLQIVDELAEMANVQLELRVAVHTGTAYAAVIGRTRLGFELTGHDVLYTSCLRQSAIRPGRVLTSRSTFNQLPEGFRGEAGPIIGLPHPLASVNPNSEPSSATVKTMETYFVQPRQVTNKPTGCKTNDTDSTTPVIKVTNPEWPKLGELSLENLGLLNRLTTAASIVCRRPTSESSPVHSTGSVEIPFDSFFSATGSAMTAREEAEESKEAQLGLLRALSNSEFDETTSSRPVTHATRLSEDAASARDPSTSELLAMAAVTLAQSFERGADTLDCSDKLVPCQSRAGRLRGKWYSAFFDQNMGYFVSLASEYRRFSVDGPDLADGACELGPENSMGVSQATTTTLAANNGQVDSEMTTALPEAETSWKPLVQQLPWLCTSPSGVRAPHWLTMTTKLTPCCGITCSGHCKDAILYTHFSETESKKRGWRSSCCCNSHDSTVGTKEDDGASTHAEASQLPGNLTHVLTMATGILLPYGLLVAVINLLTISGALVNRQEGISLHICNLDIILRYLVPFLRPLGPVVHAIPARALITGSIFVVVAAELITLSLCQPAYSTKVLLNASLDSHVAPTAPVLLLPPRNPSTMSNSTTNQMCMIPVQFALLSSISCLLPAIVYATVIYASSVPGSGSDSQKAHQTSPSACTVYTPQLTRFWCTFLIFSAHGAVYFWAVFHNDMFRQLQPSSSNFPGMNLLSSIVIQHWYGLFAFSLLAFVLPRNLEYQARLLRQWITKGNDAVQSLSATRLALARLLISAVPRFVVAVLCSPSRACELYSKPYHLVGLVLIQLSVNPDPRAKGCSMNRVAGTPNDPTDKSAVTEEEEEEPAQIADRLRLLNHMISLIDGLAAAGGGVTKRSKSSRDGGGSLIGRMNDSQLIDSAPSLVKVHVGGATVGYAVGLLPSDTIHDSDSRTEHLTHLLTFTERILEACEEVNSKARSTNSFIHLRVGWRNFALTYLAALHAGPALVGLIGKQRPVFNLWGDPVNVCLHLLHESHVPALNRQHLLLATDDVINAIPCARLNIILKSGQPLVWRCVDTQTGRILLSAQVPASAAPGGPNRSRPCLPLHFCSILATIPEPDVDYANRAAFAMLNLAKRASFKTPHPNTGAVGQRSQKVPTTAPTEQPSNVQQPLRQSAVVSQIQQPLVPDISPRPVSVVHSIPSKTVGASSNAQPYSRGHSVQSALVNQSQLVVPPPPPPHKRLYVQPKQSYAPGGPTTIQPANPDAVQSPRAAIAGPHASHSITEKLCDTSVTNHAYVRGSPERKYSEPPATITRQALRRGVVSQCAAAHTHDYSIVNFEPPEPHPARVTSQLLEPRPSTQPPIPHMMSRKGEYWPNIPNKSSENGVPLDLRLKQCRVGHESTEKMKPPIPTPLLKQAERPSANHLRPVSLSSTDSFLAAERACAAGSDELVNTDRVTDSSKFVTPNGRSLREEEQSGSGTEFVSHHNPLYTDNEYDSMTESQGNLLNPGKRKRTRRASQTTRSSSTHSKNGKLSSEKISLLSTHDRNVTAHSSHASSFEKKSESGHIGGAMDMPATPKFRVPCTKEGLVVSDRLLDFPDIQRPPSPGGYPHCKIGLIKTNLVPTPEFCGQSPKDTGSPPASDVDAIDGEYAGTYSLGPLSMAVQPSIADDGITSCDGDFGDYEDEGNSHEEVEDEDQSAVPESMSSSYTRPLLYPGWSQQRPLTTNQFNLDLPMGTHLPQSCMTDSLLANPDLDARESELADELEPSRLNSPDEPIDPRQAPSLLEAAFVPLSLPHECICESDGDEMFAYHNRPGVFHINPYSVQGHSRLVPSELQQPQQTKNSVTPAKNGRVAGGYFPPGPQFISEHSIQLQCSPRPGKPSLPEIAPVSLPNFTRQVTSPVTDEIGQSDYDNLSHPNASLLNNHSSSNGRSSQKPLDKYHWQRPPPDDGTATVSCYATSSVYDTGDDADVDDDYKQGGIFKPVLSPCSLSSQPKMNVLVPTAIPGAAGPGSPQMSMSGVNRHTNGQVQSPNPCRLLPVIDGMKAAQSTDKTATFNSDQLLPTKGLNRTPSSAASHASSVDQQRSEYDNVDRSSVSGPHSETSHSPIVPNGTPSLHDNRPSRVGSTGKVPSERHLRGGVRAMFDAEIAAEAQRISRQFRAMGWIPASDYVQSFGDTNDLVADGLLTENSHFPDIKHSHPRPKSPVRDPPRPHLFLLPLDPQRSTPCSRQASFRNRHRRGLASAADSETVTSVTSQLDDDFDEDYGARTDASDFEEIINETVQYAEDCSKLNSGAWVSDSYPDRELGCLMVRPRSLSATCLNDSAPVSDALAGLLLASDLSEVSSDERDGMMSDPETDDLHQKSYLDDHHNAQRSAAPSARLCDRQHKAVRRVKSSRTSQRPSDVNEDNAGFVRLKRRAARVRSLLPPDLQPFVLPGCMSSLSRSSSVASSIGLHHLKTGLVFLSLSRRQSSGKSISTRHRKRRCRLPRCSSDPELRIKAIKGCS
ncbi:Ca(2+)/calmodulin-responsive adenylate cyclase [Clonorchis sinensis]|uniref:adenylate cyclase n=1 Tax=Clonorchis sinensis TaxID=79923 RepID=H2KV68_CLOSI|nr:Ca(2+)/calmodulin-responsive adenylate cyclase [Clonorchis sinensis]